MYFIKKDIPTSKQQIIVQKKMTYNPKKIFPIFVWPVKERPAEIAIKVAAPIYPSLRIMEYRFIAAISSAESGGKSTDLVDAGAGDGAGLGFCDSISFVGPSEGLSFHVLFAQLGAVSSSSIGCDFDVTAEVTACWTFLSEAAAQNAFCAAGFFATVVAAETAACCVSSSSNQDGLVAMIDKFLQMGNGVTHSTTLEPRV
jgi:hypothetical protein